MSVISTSESKIELKVPYSCKCAFCGADINKEKKIVSKGYVSQGGYFTEEQKTHAAILSSMSAQDSLKYEVEYAQKRLAHYRQTVKEGRLKAFLETGKAKKEEWFRVEEGTPLDNYLKQKIKSFNDPVYVSQTPRTDFPYVWQDHANVSGMKVKCPNCKKRLPWSYNLRCNDIKTWVFLIDGFSFNGLTVAGALYYTNHPSKESNFIMWIMLGVLVFAVAIGFVLYHIFKKRRFKKLAAMSWEMENLPQYDAEFIGKYIEVPNTGDKLTEV